MNPSQGLIACIGEWVEPTDFPLSIDGFDRWVHAIGAKHIDCHRELCVPPAGRVMLWEDVGRPLLVPPWVYWGNLGAVVLLVDHIRRLINQPINYRYGYRPVDFNRAVHGSCRSDHLTGSAVDIDCRNDDDRAWFLKHLKKWAYLPGQPALLSVGSAARGRASTRVHVGVNAPATVAKGSARTWSYPPGGSIW